MMKEYLWAEKADKIIFKIMFAVSILSAVSLLVVAVLCTVDSLSSRFFSVSIPSGTDWVTYLNIPVVFLAMGFLQVERGNTVVDLLSGKFPEGVQKVLKIFGYAIAVLLCLFLARCEYGLMMDKIAKHAMSSGQTSAFPIWPFALMVATGYLLVAISFAWCIFREFLIPPEKRMGGMTPMPEEREADLAIADVVTGQMKVKAESGEEES